MIKPKNILCSLVLIFSFLLRNQTIAQSNRPHIIIIYTDDMGIGDLSCYNSGWVTTPHIDSLAAGGVKFNNYYSASPVCSPSRAAITTGIFPTELGINTYLHSREGNKKHEQYDFLDPQWPSMARMLQNSGYKTGHIGKWHLGGGRDVDDAPQITEYGFDEYVTTYEGPDPDKLITASNWIWSEQDSIKRWERTGYFVDKTLDFLSRNQKSPCFVNLWPDDMHDPWIPSENYYDDKQAWTGKEAFVQVLKEYDKQIGRLIKGLKDLEIFDNTLIIFTSDNGAYPTFEQIRTNSQRGAKNSLYEGGVRMPFLAHWPNEIEAGTVDSETVLSSVDLLPTISYITGAEIPQNYKGSGENMSKALLGNKPQKRTTDLMWDFGRNKHFNRPKQPHHQSQHLAIRRGPWKLLVNSDGSKKELFHLGDDRNETTNIAKKHPEIAEELSSKVIGWFTTKKKVRE
ncbi:sulfatase-like hydrolase/transferase [Euzebyella marina]|uniref:sulfatase-like hydrolase/transferase n=1 Tax=Euzebyella marina TaxID=1761453 RepID=UPI001969B93C|nr:sulfatase-like hydrolase/transferase [Euzebyella marina]